MCSVLQLASMYKVLLIKPYSKVFLWNGIWYLYWFEPVGYLYSKKKEAKVKVNSDSSKSATNVFDNLTDRFVSKTFNFLKLQLYAGLKYNDSIQVFWSFHLLILILGTIYELGLRPEMAFFTMSWAENSISKLFREKLYSRMKTSQSLLPLTIDSSTMYQLRSLKYG